MTLIEMRMAFSFVGACLLVTLYLLRRKGRLRHADYVAVVAMMLAAQEIPIGGLLLACGWNPSACKQFGAEVPELFRFDIFLAGAVLLMASVTGVSALFGRAMKVTRTRKSDAKGANLGSIPGVSVGPKDEAERPAQIGAGGS